MRYCFLLLVVVFVGCASSKARLESTLYENERVKVKLICEVKPQVLES